MVDQVKRNWLTYGNWLRCLNAARRFVEVSFHVAMLEHMAEKWNTSDERRFLASRHL